MIEHNVTITNRVVKVNENDYIVSENENVDTLKATFDNSWDNLDLITVSFENNGYYKKVNYEADMAIPEELIAAPGELLLTFVGSKVTDNSVVKIITKKMLLGIPVVEAGKHC